MVTTTQTCVHRWLPVANEDGEVKVDNRGMAWWYCTKCPERRLKLSNCWGKGNKDTWKYYPPKKPEEKKTRQEKAEEQAVSEAMVSLYLFRPKRRKDLY